MLQECWASTVIFIGILSQCRLRGRKLRVSIIRVCFGLTKIRIILETETRISRFYIT